jgi:hypothetical protein
MENKPGIDENNKYSMVNAHCAAKIITLRWSSSRHYFDLGLNIELIMVETKQKIIR